MTVARTLTLASGQRRFPVASLEDAACKFCAVRDRIGEGGSKTPVPLLYDSTGALVGYISYNGRVWEGTPREWSGATRLLWDGRK